MSRNKSAVFASYASIQVSRLEMCAQLVNYFDIQGIELFKGFLV